MMSPYPHLLRRFLSRPNKTRDSTELHDTDLDSIPGTAYGLTSLTRDDPKEKSDDKNLNLLLTISSEVAYQVPKTPLKHFHSMVCSFFHYFYNKLKEVHAFVMARDMSV